VILPDDMVQHQTGCLAQMAAQYETVGGNLVAVENVPAEETYRYGVLDPRAEAGDLVEVKGLVEKPAPEDAPSTLAIIGRYILDAKIMDTLSAFKKGAGGEIQITDAMAELIGQVPMHGFRFAGTRYDCGNRDGFLEANLAFALAEGGDALKQRLRQLLD
ncbi:MAG: sugar phosphate nucleotidyltransferase, partial [Parvibaculales bacterium]